jgi:Mitochondrial carrier protein
MYHLLTQVIKTKIMTQTGTSEGSNRSRTSIVSVSRQLFNERGFRAFFAGGATRSIW